MVSLMPMGKVTALVMDKNRLCGTVAPVLELPMVASEEEVRMEHMHLLPMVVS